jgi:sugar phosphate permease
VVIGFSATKELFPVEIAGTSIGMINLFPFAGGAMCQPLFGLILQNYGQVDNKYSVVAYQSGFLLLMVCAVLAICSACMIKETLEKNAT